MTPLATFDEHESSTAWPVSRLLWIVGIFASLAAASISFGDIDLPPFPLLIPMQMTAVMLLDGITAFLLLAQFWHLRLSSYAVLASAYLLAVFIAVPFLLTFPGLSQTNTPILGGPQSAVWLWHSWHMGFPLLIGISIALYRRATTLVAENSQILRQALSATVLSGLGAAVLTAAVTLGQDDLPVLLVPGFSHPQTELFFAISSVEGAIDLAAIALCWPLARKGSLLHQWLFIALVAFLGEIVASVCADHRYTLGWYCSRLQGVIANGVVMVMLLAETGRIYGRLRSALEQARKDRARLWGDTKALRISEERHRLLATGIRDHGVFMLDPAGRIMTWSIGAERLHGYSAAQVNGRPISLFFPPDDIAAHKPEHLLANARDAGHVTDDGWRVRKDGTRYPAHMSVSALRDATGQLAGYGIIVRDLSKDHHDHYRGLVQIAGS